MARLEQRTDDLATDVRTLAPLVVAVAEVKLAISHVEMDARDTRQAIDGLKTELKQREEQREKDEKERRVSEQRDSRNFRRTLIGIAIAAVLSPIGTIIVAIVMGRSG